jgi:hypothetical protein
VTRNFCDVLSTTKTIALPMTFTSSLRLMPHLQARERSIISQFSHDVSGRSDIQNTSSQLLRSTTVTPARVYGSRCTT